MPGWPRSMLYDMRTGLLFLICFCVIPLLDAQPLDFLRADTLGTTRELPPVTAVTLKVMYGNPLTTDVPVLEETIENYPSKSVELRIGVGSYGRKMWQQLDHYPDYGFGFYQCRLLPADNPLGQPRAVFFYYNQSLLRTGRFSLNYDFASGMSFNFRPYDPVTNPRQVGIGSKKNGYVSLDLEGRVRLSDRLSLGIGINHNHFSNGRIRTPQRGINLVSVNGSLTMHFIDPVSRRKYGYGQGSPLPAPVKHELPQFSPRWEFYTVGNAALATPGNNYKDRETVYSIYTASFAVARHYSFKGKIVACFDVFYDESLSELYGVPLEELPRKDKYYHGLMAGHELMINRFTFVTLMGLTLDNRDVKGNWYSRMALRYDVTRHFFLRVALKLPDNWESDFIEWGAGFNVYTR